MMWQLQHQLPSQYHICPVSTASLHESQVHQTTSKHVVACDTTWAIGWAMNGVSVLLHSVTVQLTALKCLFFNLCRLVLHVAVPHVVSNCIAMHQVLSRAINKASFIQNHCRKSTTFLRLCLTICAWVSHVLFDQLQIRSSVKIHSTSSTAVSHGYCCLSISTMKHRLKTAFGEAKRRAHTTALARFAMIDGNNKQHWETNERTVNERPWTPQYEPNISVSLRTSTVTVKPYVLIFVSEPIINWSLGVIFIYLAALAHPKRTWHPGNLQLVEVTSTT